MFLFLQTARRIAKGAQEHTDGADPPDPQRHGQGQRSDQRTGHVHRGRRRANRRPLQALLL